MLRSTATVDRSVLGLHSIEQYEPYIGKRAVERIAAKVDKLGATKVAHVSSTFYGGGVTEILTPLTLMMNAAGIETDWHLVQGTPDFFSFTKQLHNAMQGAAIEPSEVERAIYEQVVFENAVRLHLEDCDAVIVHDPQPLPLIGHFAEREMPWIWQCHVDLSSPCASTWSYLRPFIEEYDTAVFSLPEYAQSLEINQRFIAPAIDPFSPKNMELSEQEILGTLAQYQIPVDRPLLAQISRFDRWKDPLGVIAAFRKAKQQVDCRLVLLGSNASDDPEARTILEAVQAEACDDIIVLAVDDPVLVNALQRRAEIILQKSTREGFGLTVTEAMWKGAAVIGGDVGGIRRQIRSGENGVLVGSVDEAAQHIVHLLRNVHLRKRFGAQAKATVRENFLMSRLMEDWLDLLGGHQQSLPA